MSISMARHRRIDVLARQQRCFGYAAISRLEHQTPTVYPRHGIDHLLRPGAQDRWMAAPIDDQAGGRERAVAAEDDQRHRRFGGHRQRPDESSRPFQLHFEALFEGREVRIRIASVQ